MLDPDKKLTKLFLNTDRHIKLIIRLISVTYAQLITTINKAIDNDIIKILVTSCDSP